MTRTSWIGSKAPAQEVRSVRSRALGGPSFKTTVRARGLGPAGGYIDGMTDEDCILRTVALLDVDSQVEFDAVRADGSSYVVRGRIRSRLSVPPRFEYAVELERPKLIVDPRSPADEAGTRRRVRLEIEFPLQYRTAKEGSKAGKARNVSTGGLLMTCREALVEGMVLELYFVLPSDVLNVYPQRSTVFDFRGGFKRRSVPSKLRRPFDDIVVSARIVHHRPLGEGFYAYGVSFLHLDRRVAAEIGRFVDAVRHVKTRQKP